MPTTNVFEGTSVTLSARATSPNWKGKNVDFGIVQSGSGAVVPNHTDTFNIYLARYEIASLPVVHENDVNYLLEYTVTVDANVRQANQKYRVWPARYEIEGEFADGSAAPYCTFSVTGGDCTGEVTLDGFGKGQYEPRSAGDEPRFQPKSPYQLVAWISAAGRKRKARLSRIAYTAEFWEPRWADIPDGLQFGSALAASGRGFYQIVNLTAPDPYYGTSIRFKVGAQGDQARAQGARLGQMNDVIHVQVEFQAGNSARNDNPKPGVHQTVGGALVEAHTTPNQVFTVQLGADGAGAEFDVVCGHAGSDKIVVKVGVTPACTDASYEIETRRRVFYQVTRSAGQANPNLARSEAALDAVGVKLSRYKVVSLAAGDAPPGASVSWLPGAYWGGGPDRLNVGDYNSTYYHNKWVNTDARGIVVSPRLHVLYTDVQYDSDDPLTSGDPDDHRFWAAFGGALGNASLINWNAGPPVVGHRMPLNMAGLGLFSQRLYDGSHPFIQGFWEVVGTGGAISGNLSSNDVWLGTDHLSIKAPAACGPHLAGGHQICFVDVAIACAQGPFLGEANGGRILCVVTQTNNDINDTLTHEVGHVMDLVAAVCPPGLNLANHTRQYVANQHQGGHCAEGMNGAAYNNGVGSVAHGTAGNFRGLNLPCVMYGEGSTACTGQFCHLCEPFAKAAEVT